MVLSSQLNPGMTLSINNKLYRVESSVKVNASKGAPFIKAKLRDLDTQEMVEKSFKTNQSLQDVTLVERKLEFLYPEGKGYLFLDVNNLEQINVPSKIIGAKVNYLKEGVDLTASFYGDTIFNVELPQFLELMVSKIEASKAKNADGAQIATLETGATIDVPPYVNVGDIIKIDTQNEEFMQRV